MASRGAATSVVKVFVSYDWKWKYWISNFYDDGESICGILRLEDFPFVKERFEFEKEEKFTNSMNILKEQVGFKSWEQNGGFSNSHY